MRWNKRNTGIPPASLRTPRQRSGGRRGTGALLWFVLIAFALVSVAPLVNLWKAAMRGEHVPSSAEEAKLRHCVGYQNIALFPPDRIEFRSSCLQVDLGAIGKGYAVDRAVEILRSYGVERALINA